MKFEFELRWIDIESGQGKAYCFPGGPTSYMQRYCKPGVYRWAVFAADGVLKAVYVGEAEDIRRRLKDYLHPGNRKTALRIEAFLRACQAADLQVRFQTVFFDDFAINRSEFKCAKLSDPFARKVVENLAVLQASGSNCQVLNKGIDAIQKKFETVFKKVPEVFSKFTTTQKAEFMKKLSASVESKATSSAR